MSLDNFVLNTYNDNMFKRKGNDHEFNWQSEASTSDPGASRSSAAQAGPGDDTSTGDESDSCPSEPLIEVVQSDMPILAKREADLALGRHLLEHPFGTVTTDGSFGVVSEAHCRARYRTVYNNGVYTEVMTHEHEDVPNLDCSCGFYAIPVDAPPSPYTEPFRITLLVELYGKVIEHDLGYRAQYQKVVECQIPPCVYCGRQADYVLLSDVMVTQRFVCTAHTTDTHVGFIYLDIDSLERRIGVPITRLELPWNN